MAQLLYSTPWTRQPQTRTGKNTALQGLVSAIPWQWDAGGNSVVLDSGIVPSATLRGLLLSGFNGSTLKVATGVRRLSAPPFTIIFDYVSTGVATANALVTQGGAGGGGGGWSVNVASATPSGFRFTFGGVADYSSASGSLTTGVLYRIGVVVSGNGGTARYFINGVFDSSRAVGTMATPTADLAIGAAWNGSAWVIPALSGVLLGNVTLYNRALLDSEMLTDFFNPFFVYQSIPSRIWVGAAAAGGTFQPAWALGSNASVIGSGIHA
jgi:Concanavalin A-like lectin/glucanases superfamily